jgi:branched-chain amino acid aminotransferase
VPDPGRARDSEPPARASAPARRIWIDGEFVPWERATVHVLSHSMQRGSLVFDYMSVHETPRGAAVFRLGDHLARFLHSIALVGLPLTWNAERIRSGILETARANPGATAIKVSAYLPSVEADLVPLDDRVEVAIAAYDPIRDVILPKGRGRAFPDALRIRIERERRKIDAVLPPQAKAAAGYLGPMSAKWAARRAGFDEIVLVDAAGGLAEGPTTNVFLVERDGTLATPPVGSILEGITRRSILEIAKHDGIPAREATLRPEALFEAAEAFLTGTTAGVWPVVSVDGRPIGEGTIGPVTRTLRERFQTVASGRDPAFAHWLTAVTAT